MVNVKRAQETEAVFELVTGYHSTIIDSAEGHGRRRMVGRRLDQPPATERSLIELLAIIESRLREGPRASVVGRFGHWEQFLPTGQPETAPTATRRFSDVTYVSRPSGRGCCAFKKQESGRLIEHKFYVAD